MPVLHVDSSFVGKQKGTNIMANNSEQNKATVRAFYDMAFNQKQRKKL